MSPSLVVFGPQTTWPSSAYLSQIRESLLEEPLLNPLLNAIRELPSFWQTLVDYNPDLNRVPGSHILQQFRQWVEGTPISLDGTPANVFLTPLTVVIHIVLYLRFLKRNKASTNHSLILESAKDAGIQGFCTGILSAIPLACAQDEEEIGQLSTVALRLAVCIGAIVDLDGPFANPSNEYTCVAIRYKDETGLQKVTQVLQTYPDAYASVLTDNMNLTITAPWSTAKDLIRDLSACGLLAKPIELKGRFHSQVHREAMKKLITLCKEHSELQFPQVARLKTSLRSSSDGSAVSSGSLDELAIRTMLTERADWQRVLANTLPLTAKTKANPVLVIGLVDCIPASMVRQYGLTVERLGGPGVLLNNEPTTILNNSASISALPASTTHDSKPYPDNSIAIVGMGCKFAGADSLDAFWQVIQSGASMHSQVPIERFPTQGLRRNNDPDFKFWGNFIQDADTFDHKMFNKSSREAAQMDPQQRQLLEVTYRAMESAGYFGEFSDSHPDDIGCFIGNATSDYDDNVAAHGTTAFSATGTLRAFLSGRISHHFGWTGPSITYDTACSSSMVAIHAACKALKDGECSRAVAGGVHVLTSPNLHQNLAAATFLSPTGPTKAFDAKADGYCRGEGVGVLVLKKLDRALADNDTILGVIAGTAINQNSNEASITAPNQKSQIKLFERVLSLSGIDPLDISVVESHGTGTRLGDPIECQSIRTVFAGPSRKETLHLGSVKSSIGHTEAASGVAGIIKTLLMMQHHIIPPQANFSTLNPNIQPLELDRIRIAQSPEKWETKFKVACINNYGAAGSNACMILCQPPLPSQAQPQTLAKYPIFLSANSTASLWAYCQALEKKITQLSSTMSEEALLANVAFNLATNQNRTLPHFLAAAVTSLSELRGLLAKNASAATGRPDSAILAKSKTRPVVLAFGGQTSNLISLSEATYNSTSLLRFHLNKCDEVLRSAGLRGLFPTIFQERPIEDVVSFHACLFSFQYACAKSWIESGLHVDALIGHSFGQLTALCVAGSMSLEDGLRLIVGRASLMQKYWGSERGSMIAVEADLHTVSEIMAAVSSPGSEDGLEIACYNGPTSHVLVGTAKAISKVEHIVAKENKSFGSAKAKKLNVLYGFHSRYTEPILSRFAELAQSIVYREPSIPVETCSESESWTSIEPKLIVDQTRSPVHFQQAVERLARRLGPCAWIEAGSTSTITNMARHALGGSASKHLFQPLNLGSSSSPGSLVDGTINLWRASHVVQFWPYHRSQKQEYSEINLPPYQFEKNRHWLSWADGAVATPPVQHVTSAAEPTFLSFVRFNDQDGQVAEFAIDPRSKKFSIMVGGHSIMGSPLCPASVYTDVAIEAAMNLLRKESNEDSEYTPCIDNLEIHSALGLNSDRTISLSLTRQAARRWTFTLSSHSGNKGPDKTASSTRHATGAISLECDSNGTTCASFARYERIIDHRCYRSLFDDPEAEAMQGSLVYKVFGQLVDYADFFRGVQSVSSKNQEVVGVVQMPKHGEAALVPGTWNPLEIDSFIQVAGLHVNFLSAKGKDEAFIATNIERIQSGPEFVKDLAESRSWSVYSNCAPIGSKEVTNDIFVFDSVSHRLALVILGVRFTRVPTASLIKMLSRVNSAKPTLAKNGVNAGQQSPGLRTVNRMARKSHKKDLSISTNVTDPITSAYKEPRTATFFRQSGLEDFLTKLRKLLSHTTDVPMESLTAHTAFDEIGIDSLMSSEVLSEIRREFDVSISTSEFAGLHDIQALCNFILPKRTGAVSLRTPTVAPKTVSNDNDLEEFQLKVKTLLSSVIDVPLDALIPEATFDELGVDSLMVSEVLSEIRRSFDISIPAAEFSALENLQALYSYLFHAGSVILKPSEKPIVSKPYSDFAPSLEYTTPSEHRSLTTTANHSRSHSQHSFELIHDDPADHPSNVSLYPRAFSLMLQGSRKSTRNIFAFPGGFGTAATYNPLPTLSPSLAFYGLNSPFLKNPEDFTLPLDQLVALYLAEIKRVQPKGPYLILGYSVGGVMAYEAVRQLIEGGDQVERLILVDSACPLLVPPFPVSLLTFLDSIDRFTGGKQADEEIPVKKEEAKPMEDLHVKKTLTSLHRYRPTPVPKERVPKTTLFMAREGVDKQNAVVRPRVTAEEEKVLNWLLDDRTNFQASGWDRLLSREQLSVVPIDGNHFSIMKDPYITQVSDGIKKVLCPEWELL